MFFKHRNVLFACVRLYWSGLYVSKHSKLVKHMLLSTQFLFLGTSFPCWWPPFPYKIMSFFQFGIGQFIWLLLNLNTEYKLSFLAVLLLGFPKSAAVFLLHESYLGRKKDNWIRRHIMQVSWDCPGHHHDKITLISWKLYNLTLSVIYCICRRTNGKRTSVGTEVRIEDNSR